LSKRKFYCLKTLHLDNGQDLILGPNSPFKNSLLLGLISW